VFWGKVEGEKQESLSLVLSILKIERRGGGGRSNHVSQPFSGALDLRPSCEKHGSVPSLSFKGERGGKRKKRGLPPATCKQKGGNWGWANSKILSQRKIQRKKELVLYKKKTFEGKERNHSPKPNLHQERKGGGGCQRELLYSERSAL